MIVTDYQDAANPAIHHVVRTGCATLKPVECAIEHQKMVTAMLAVFPAANK